MGYTHYWTFRSPAKGQAKSVEKAYQQAIKECSKIAKAYQKDALGYERLSGYTAHAPSWSYGGLHINGKSELAHENFTMREHFKQNLGWRNNFCKTAQKPYDVVVVACLIVLKHRLGKYFEVESDGLQHDWQTGLELAKQVLKLKKLSIPASISVTRERVA